MTADVDVVIVGGGPIGLAHAWGLKKLNSELQIVVLERNPIYLRHHNLVVKPDKLAELIRLTQTEQDPRLQTLLQLLKNDPNIAIKDLEETFKALALDCGVKIIIQEVKKDCIEEQVFAQYPNAKLIIGADGTHSVINQALFPAGNQVKHEFDFVLQLRFQIKGNYKTTPTETVAFYLQMFEEGLVANEYINHAHQDITAITMQMMISKEEFSRLRTATSKNPLYILKKDHDARKSEFQGKVQHFINKYLLAKIRSLHLKGEDSIDPNTLCISVNEAPATHVKKVCIKGNNSLPILLVGDASLGLSYFKGINAGLEATAKLLSLLKPQVLAGLKDNHTLAMEVDRYEKWFLHDFVPKKVKEVAEYSTRVIRSSMAVAHIIETISATVTEPPEADLNEVVDDYFNLLVPEHQVHTHQAVHWQPYPHRGYDPVLSSSFNHVPVEYTLKRIKKIFVDYTKPYKSPGQMLKDFRQPLRGFKNLAVGLIKVSSLFFGDVQEAADGFARIVRGSIEIISTPFTWFLKPICRGIITHYSMPLKIEQNVGIQQLAHYGIENLHQEIESTSPQVAYNLLAVCNDIHRKFNKSLQRGQTSEAAAQEQTLFNELRSEDIVSKEKIAKYLGLFKPQKLVSSGSFSAETDPSLQP